MQDKTQPDTPTSVILIDWQIQRIASPVIDLSYFIYCCSSKEVYGNLNQYLKIYHDSLSSQLKSMGCDPDEALPFNVLQAQWKTYGRFGFLMCFFLIKIMLSDSSEAPDLVATAENGKNVMEAFNFTTKYDEEYKRRITDVVLHTYNNNFI